MIYCGPKIDFFHKQGTAYRTSCDKAEMLYVYMAEKIQKFTSRMRGNWTDFDLEVLARMQRNKDILFAETDNHKINVMLDELHNDGICFAELQGTVSDVEVYQEKLLKKYLHKR